MEEGAIRKRAKARAAVVALMRAGHLDLADRLVLALFGKKKVNPNQYLKEHGRCPPGFHQDQRGGCAPKEGDSPDESSDEDSTLRDAIKKGAGSDDYGSKKMARKIRTTLQDIKELKDSLQHVNPKDPEARRITNKIQRKIALRREEAEELAKKILHG